MQVPYLKVVGVVVQPSLASLSLVVKRRVRLRWRLRRRGSCGWGLGAQPPAGSRGRAPCGGLGGRSPPGKFLKKRTFWGNFRVPEE